MFASWAEALRNPEWGHGQSCYHITVISKNLIHSNERTTQDFCHFWLPVSGFSIWQRLGCTGWRKEATLCYHLVHCQETKEAGLWEMFLPTCVMLLPYLWSTLTKTRSGNERVQMAMARDCEFETKGGPHIHNSLTSEAHYLMLRCLLSFFPLCCAA